MRHDRVAYCSLVVCGFVLAGCGGGGENKDSAQPTPTASRARATSGAVVGATAPATVTVAPTATPTEEPTATPAATATATPEPAALPTSPPEPAAAAPGDLQLLGIVRAGAAPSAVIAYQGKQEIFRKGDTVFDHGTVKDVRDDSVVIRSGDQDVTLKIATAEAPPKEAEPAPEVVESRPPPLAEAAVPPRGALPRADVRAALRDLRSLLAKADAKRVSVGGGHGLQLTKVEPASFFARLGLRSGDVLQKLDGFPVDDAERPPDLSSAAEGKELTVGFTRDDIGLTVTRSIE
jgi:type II secretory pathway component PulC